MASTVVCFDLDETLFKYDPTKAARILVNDERGGVHEITNVEYGSYKLKPGEKYDFRRFTEANIFADSAKPIQIVIDRLTRIMDIEGIRVAIVTARGTFDDMDLFRDTLCAHGISRDVELWMTGMPHPRYDPNPADYAKSTAELKVDAFRAILHSDSEIRTIQLYDDQLRNIVAFLEMEDEFPGVALEPMLVHEQNGLVLMKEIRREDVLA